MNERLKELAEQAGIAFDSSGAPDTFGSLPDFLERFAELVRQDEREACAKLCEETYVRQIIYYPKNYHVDPNKMGEYSEHTAKRCAAAIRARGNHG